MAFQGKVAHPTYETHKRLSSRVEVKSFEWGKLGSELGIWGERIPTMQGPLSRPFPKRILEPQGHMDSDRPCRIHPYGVVDVHPALSDIFGHHLTESCDEIPRDICAVASEAQLYLAFGDCELVSFGGV